jgi:hypothetical protein
MTLQAISHTTFLIIVYASVCLTTIQKSSGQSTPNVVLINVDDWGWMDYGLKNPQWFKP